MIPPPGRRGQREILGRETPVMPSRLNCDRSPFSRPADHVSAILGGGWWIRTTVGASRQVYSLLPLATRATHRAGLSYLSWAPQSFCAVTSTAWVRGCSLAAVVFRFLVVLGSARIPELARGIEPLTSCLQNRCSAGLSYASGLSVGPAEPSRRAGRRPGQDLKDRFARAGL